MAQAPLDAFTVTVLAFDLALIDELAEQGDDLRLRVDEPRLFPGAVDTFGQIIATLQGVDLGVAESLIAAWIWEARVRARGRQLPPTVTTGVKVKLRVCRAGSEIEFEVESDTQEGIKDIIATTLANARLDG